MPGFSPIFGVQMNDRERSRALLTRIRNQQVQGSSPCAGSNLVNNLRDVASRGRSSWGPHGVQDDGATYAEDQVESELGRVSVRAIFVVVALVVSVTALVAGTIEKAGSYTVRVTYSALTSRVGNPPAVLEYTVEEYQETGITSERGALDRARTIARDGFVLDVEGRAIVVPPSRIELAEVLDVP